MKAILFSLGLLGLSIADTRAQDACVMNYPAFEVSIPHLDLPSCPKDLARPGAFCRVTAANDAVHVFVFEEKGRQCLLAMKTYRDYELGVK